MKIIGQKGSQKTLRCFEFLDVVGSYVDRLTKLQEEVDAFLNKEKEDKVMERMAKDIKVVEDRLSGKAEPVKPQKAPLPGFSKDGKSRKWKKRREFLVFDEILALDSCLIFSC